MSIVQVPQHRHFAALDGLRGVAAIMVLAFHLLGPFQVLLPHASLAVDFFFLLSGFVICYAYERALLTNMSLVEFLKVRLIRLYPLFIVGQLFGFLVFLVKSHVQHQSVDINAFIAFLLGALVLPSSLVRSDGWDAMFPFNSPSWSLFFELLVNAVYALIVFRLSRGLLLTILLLGAIAVAVQAHFLGSINGGDRLDTIIYGLGRVVFPFFCGIFLFRWLARHPNFNISLPAPILALTFVTALVLPAGRYNWEFETAVVLFLFPGIVLCAVGSDLSPKTRAACLFFGKLSYPLYILHYPLFRVFGNLAKSLIVEPDQMWMVMVVQTICAILLAILTMKLFDEPFRAWLLAHRRRKSSENAIGPVPHKPLRSS